MKTTNFGAYAQKSKSKYGNVKTEYNGHKFDSKKEAQYCATLDLLKRATDPKKRVISYSLQVPYRISLNGHKICTYYADFVVKYADHEEIIDVKGKKTDVYRLKKKLVEAQYGVKIIEV